LIEYKIRRARRHRGARLVRKLPKVVNAHPDAESLRERAPGRRPEKADQA
jgi:hypothetical protein